jgi:hypothetical protein
MIMPRHVRLWSKEDEVGAGGGEEVEEEERSVVV